MDHLRFVAAVRRPTVSQKCRSSASQFSTQRPGRIASSASGRAGPAGLIWSAARPAPAGRAGDGVVAAAAAAGASCGVGPDWPVRSVVLMATSASE
ncbi:hypothetical protein GCM10022377_22170 [Zhihengliuella alba]|uniref:Uncharacterized protein n=1 Tax=Zhihengliuella alba TaxID=547018 RepID=A0ABP7DR01_9MICC